MIKKIDEILKGDYETHTVSAEFLTEVKNEIIRLNETLDKTIKNWSGITGVLNERILEEQNIVAELKDALDKEDFWNKTEVGHLKLREARYREALAFYAQDATWIGKPNLALSDGGKKAQKALEGLPDEVPKENDELKRLEAENELLAKKIITCGVAASHPDPDLANQDPYSGKWDSPQAEKVRKLRKDRDQLKKWQDELINLNMEICPKDWGRDFSDPERTAGQIKSVIVGLGNIETKE